ncbi:MAG: DEAD/DEAH box helicase [Myxococcales bacterium]|nr:DEAD/DEAH box helicase [Myxococcales bacterium]
MSLARFHPIVASWFTAHFPAPTPAQRDGWPAIAAGHDTLIAAPTGAGKTLAAFLWCLDRLARRAFDGALGPHLDTLYLTPLKALGNDIERNLRAPLDGIRAAARQAGLAPPAIEVAVRSGDTPANQRARMTRTPPHILITTPESLYILLTSQSGRRMLSTVRTVIVDEIHAVAGSKRGSHLALSLERLDALCAHGPDAPPEPDADGPDAEATADAETAAPAEPPAPWTPRPPPVRIGLSATQKPIERVARLLVGTRRPLPTVVDAGHARPLDLAIEVPDDELAAIASKEQMAQILDRMAALVAAHRTTLVFTNTRRMAERVCHALGERLGEGAVAAHHGSLSKKKRLDAEQRLKAAEVKCVVATASLELGIDVGDVELVVQLGSPRCIATFVQRVGRAGHWVGGTPKGRLFAVTRDEAVECAALVRAVRAGELDAIRLLDAPLDILAQQLVAEVAARPCDEDALYALVRGALPYAELPRDRFDQVVDMLADGIATRRGRSTAHLHRDRVNQRLRARRGARLAAITGGGAIPDRADYTVIAEPDEAVVGTVDEDFAVESRAGDVFLLGNTPWRVRRVETGRVRVEHAPGASPSVPFWFGEAPARTAELSTAVGRLRAEVEARLDRGRTRDAIARWLAAETTLPPPAAALVTDYLAASRQALGQLPTDTTLVAERFFDEGGGMQLVIHAPLGGRINRAWGLALRKRFCASFNFELQAAATDDGLVISLGPHHSFPLPTVFDFVTPTTAERVLTQAVVTNPPLLGARWRWTAIRGLALLRRAGGRPVPPQILRMRAEDLLAAVFPDAAACQENVHGPIDPPDHPLVQETLADCMRDFMDIDGLCDVLRRIERGDIRVHAVDTTEASPLSHELLNANPYAFLDDAPLEERRTRAVALGRRLKIDPDGLAALDPEAIAAVVADARPPLRDPDELHDALLGWIACPPAAIGPDDRDPALVACFDRLVRARRAVRATWTDDTGAPRADIWIPSERAAWITALMPDARFTPAPPVLTPTWPGEGEGDLDAIAKAIVRGHLDTAGPLTPAEIAHRLALPRPRVDAALAALEGDGNILRGRFRPGLADEEWCERRLLARIHRQTLGRLRRAVEPVSAADFMRFLFAWHAVAPLPPVAGADGTTERRPVADPRRAGVDGLAQLIEQLQGFELPAAAWEAHVLPARLRDYDPALLDLLCLSGRLTWGRLAARDTTATPTRAAPIALMQRTDRPWLLAAAPPVEGDAGRDGMARDGITRDGITRDGITRDGMARDGMARDGTTRDGMTRDGMTRGPLPVPAPSPADAAAPPDPTTATAAAIHRRLAERGAAFTDELTAATGRPPAEIEAALWSLVAAGHVTADGFDGLRRLIGPTARGPIGSGRWALLREGLALEADPGTKATRWARLLLVRYGVVFRDLIPREDHAPPWRELLPELRRLEARGEIRGGRFVGGFSGEQFALPAAVDALRAIRDRRPDRPVYVRLSAADPLNLAGITSPGPRVPALVDNAVLYRDGVPVAARVAGKVELRVTLEDPVAVDHDLRLHPLH